MRTRAKGCVALIVVALGAGVASAAPVSAAGLALRRCTYDDGFIGGDRPVGPARCGVLTVPLVRDGAGAPVGARRLRLAVRVLPPLRGPVRETIVKLAGGPGEAATPYLDDSAKRIGAAAMRGRRLVAFDQRGTGGGPPGGALSCPSLRSATSEATLDAAVAACARRLGPARASYATADSVADLEALRVALGAPKLTLHGTSYGAKVALDYAARHPDRVERLVLDSVVPPAGVDPFGRSTLAATPRMLRALCAAGGCPFTRDAAADLATLLERIRAHGPLRGRWYDRHGRPQQLAISSARLLDLLVDGDLDPLLRIPLPAALRAAVDGDAAPLARLLAPARFRSRGEPADDDALYLATHCLDGGVPWPAGTPVSERAAATAAALAALPAQALAPFDVATVRADPLLGLCRAWPESPLPQAAGPLPDVPALLIAGGLDLRTPVEDAAAVAALLPRARLVTAPAVGHSVLAWEDGGGCATRALRAFLAGRAVAGCTGAREGAGAWPLLRPAPRRFAALTPAGRGLPPRVGRTVAALEATFTELEWMRIATVLGFMDSDWDIDDPRQPTLGWGGLRGGRAIAQDEREIGRYAIERYAVVAGMRVDGLLRPTGPDDIEVRYRLRVSGPAAARGVVTIDARRIRGRLGGRRIDLPNRARDPFAEPSATASHLQSGGSMK